MSGEDAIARVRRLLADATPGPWVNPDGYCVRRDPREPWQTVCRTWPSGQSVEQGVDDMEFIATARNILPAMCDVADAARKTQGCRLARYHALGSTYTWHDSVLVEIDQALAALDRAAEEA